MRIVFGLVLLIGMGLAGFAVYMVQQYMDGQNARLQQARERAAAVVQTEQIYAPNKDLTYGQLLRLEDLKLIRYATADLPKGVFRTRAEIFPEGEDVPRIVKIPMHVNEPILDYKVTEPGAPQGIPALLDPGMRAFPLPNTLVDDFAGEMRISDRLDLYWIGTLNGQQSSRLVKSALEIISMDEPDVNGNGGGRNVFLQVTQEDYADLRVLQAAGSLSLTPVARADDEGGDTSIQTDIMNALGIEAEEIVVAPEPEAPEICTRRERRGLNIVVIQEPCE
ncbi:MAG: Flp pilus assembly protein CpaB [Yoonia sp.]|uniref:Flp pilus assembly protein CpaB n=1 Tax=Yoonia sp. TaxID=2212373 RepID=UPI003EF82EF5